MTRLRQTTATLRITGDALAPNEITHRLSCTPTNAHAKGDELISQKTGHRRIARFGMWSLEAPSCEPGNLDAQIAWIFAATTGDLDVWLTITGLYKVDMFCGLFMGQWNDGESISTASLFSLGSRRIELDFDIYGPVGHEPEDSLSESDRTS